MTNENITHKIAEALEAASPLPFYDLGEWERKVILDTLNGCRPFDEATAAEIAAAREKYQSDDVEIDDGCGTSRAHEGTWVQGWLWVGD